MSSSLTPIDYICANCGEPGTLRCSLCLGAFYCGKECQKKMWKGHKVSCKEAAAFMAQIGATIELFDIRMEDFKRRAKEGDCKAQYNIGSCYFKGTGVTFDMQAAVEWWTRAAEGGLADAHNTLGTCYLIGQGVTRDEIKAVEFFKFGAEKGHAASMANFGLCFKKGTGGTTVEHEEAFKWFLRAAEAGNPEGQISAAFCYLGEGSVTSGAVNKQEAFRWNKKAAEAGHAGAQYNVGCALYAGHGVPVDRREAFKWYKLAAEAGNKDAQLNLGLCMHNGDGCAVNKREAIKWYTSAAEAGSAIAQYELGQAYECGYGTPEDLHKAVKWYTLAAKEGNAGGQCGLAINLQTGTGGLEKDEVKALSLFNLAAAQNDAQAIHNQGRCAQFGLGRSINLKEAFAFFTRAVALKNVPALMNLAGLMFNSTGEDGIAKDKKGAVKLMERAVAGGHPKAADTLKEMKSIMRLIEFVES